MIKPITFFVMQIRVILALPSLVPHSLGALGSCPSCLPLDPPLTLTLFLTVTGTKFLKENKTGQK